MDPENTLFEKGAVAVSGDRIVAVGEGLALTASYKAEKTVDAGGGIVMPGLASWWQVSSLVPLAIVAARRPWRSRRSN